MRKNTIVALLILGCALIAFQVLHTPSRNIEGFATLTKADPLLYAPFFDVAAFNAGVQTLAAAEDRLKATAVNNILEDDADYTETFTRIFTTHRIFPQTFLESLSAVSEATDTFLAAPTPEGAHALIEVYKTASAAYQAEAHAALEVFAEIESYTRPDRPLIYFFVDSATSMYRVRDDYRLIARNADALVDEVARREACVLGTGSCEAARQASDTSAFFDALTTTPDTTGAPVDFIQSTLPRADKARTVRGPYPAPSSCWSGSNPHWLYLVYAPEDTGALSVMPKLIGENYYRRVSPAGTDAISKAVVARGLSFYSQLETTTYECTDLTFYPRLLALDFVQKHIDDSITTHETASADATYRLLAENPFGLLGPAFQVLATYTDLLEASQHTEGRFVISPQFVYTTRSAYALTFMPFASSVWRIDEMPQYLLSREEYERLGAQRSYVSYSTLRSEGYTDDEIRKAHISQTELIESISTK